MQLARRFSFSSVLSSMAWPEQPLVSGLMVLNRPAITQMAREACRCFFSQTWPAKELLVFNATGTKLVHWSFLRRLFRNFLSEIKEICLRRMDRGAALNVLKENANGEW